MTCGENGSLFEKTLDLWPTSAHASHLALSMEASQKEGRGVLHDPHSACFASAYSSSLSEAEGDADAHRALSSPSPPKRSARRNL